MQYSSPTKTKWSSDSERPRASVRQSAAPASLIELDDVSLRFVNYADKQYSLKRAALDLVLRRESMTPTAEFWALRIDIQDYTRRTSGNCRRQRRRQEHPAPPAGEDLSPDLGQFSIRGSVAPLIELGAGFNPELSGLDNIVLNGAHPGFLQERHEGKVDQIHEFTGLREFADMPLKYYSSGMYMRLAFAIATEVNPDILLIDESLGVGDVAFQEKAKARIQNLLDRTQAVVVVSHDLDSLRKLCTRGLWIHHGKLLVNGRIDEVVDRYLEAARAPNGDVVSA